MKVSLKQLQFSKTLYPQVYLYQKHFYTHTHTHTIITCKGQQFRLRNSKCWFKNQSYWFLLEFKFSPTDNNTERRSLKRHSAPPHRWLVLMYKNKQVSSFIHILSVDIYERCVPTPSTSSIPLYTVCKGP